MFSSDRAAIEQVGLVLVVAVVAAVAVITDTPWLSPIYAPAWLVLLAAVAGCVFIVAKARPGTRSGVLALGILVLCVADFGVQVVKAVSGREMESLIMWVNHSPFVGAGAVVGGALLVHAAGSNEKRSFLRAASVLLLCAALAAIPAVPGAST